MREGGSELTFWSNTNLKARNLRETGREYTALLKSYPSIRVVSEEGRESTFLLNLLPKTSGDRRRMIVYWLMKSPPKTRYVRWEERKGTC
jgi:hypothetical protein